jgi:lipopolysaccharide/colanic/teichoic acid biosynthesis glycosyltransferase
MTHPVAKRMFDFSLAGLGLLVLSPGLALLALLVKLSDRGPVFYRQERVGQHGRLFWIWKFRTMRVGADQAGPGVTREGDPRVTRLGRWLRKSKLDELPQLWNVVRGEMSLVGPRPELPRYVAGYSVAQRAVLAFKPGITDLASLAYRHEEELLSAVADWEGYYVGHCVPRKIELNLQYGCRADLWTDTQVILRTVLPWFDRLHRP